MFCNTDDGADIADFDGDDEAAGVDVAATVGTCGIVGDGSGDAVFALFGIVFGVSPTDTSGGESVRADSFDCWVRFILYTNKTSATQTTMAATIIMRVRVGIAR